MNDFDINYDETKVPNYTLPKLLSFATGEQVKAETWQKRRQELMSLFTEKVYGHVPNRGYTLEFHAHSQDASALNGKATRQEVELLIQTPQGRANLNILMYLPNAAEEPLPAFVGLNFDGNQTIHEDEAIRVSPWQKESSNHSRGANANRWAVEEIIEQGYALVTMHCADVDADNNMQDSIHPLFFQKGQTARKDNQWGAVSAWAWGLSRIMDYLEADSRINHKQVALMGHSRLGKAALWSAAQDERFALVISNNSGCCGAALSRRCYGESIRAINTRFPTWFCENLKQFNDKEAELPVDQHMLLSLIAPRPLYIASAEEDFWADPKGEFLSAKYASEVYELLGKRGLELKNLPALNKLKLSSNVAYHIRSGDHDVTLFDWQAYLAFANHHFKHS